jgi:hypothetical protein
VSAMPISRLAHKKRKSWCALWIVDTESAPPGVRVVVAGSDSAIMARYGMGVPDRPLVSGVGGLGGVVVVVGSRRWCWRAHCETRGRFLLPPSARYPGQARATRLNWRIPRIDGRRRRVEKNAPRSNCCPSAAADATAWCLQHPTLQRSNAPTLQRSNATKAV